MISIGIFNTLNGNNGLLNVIKLYYLYGIYMKFIFDDFCNVHKWYLNNKIYIDDYIKIIERIIIYFIKFYMMIL